MTLVGGAAFLLANLADRHRLCRRQSAHQAELRRDGGTSVRSSRANGPRWLTLPVIVGCAFILFWLVVALTVDLWAPYDPLKRSPALQPPAAEHWLGTDVIGRDVLTRTLYGAQQSIARRRGGGRRSPSRSARALGAIAGFFGGLLGGAIMRLVDVTLSFPPVLLAMAVAASLGPGLRNAAIAMVIVWWPVYARLMRGQVLEVKEREHVEAAIAGGASRWRLLTKHILSLCWTPTLVNATMDFGQVVLLAASLSFIGLGAGRRRRNGAR